MPLPWPQQMPSPQESAIDHLNVPPRHSEASWTYVEYEPEYGPPAMDTSHRLSSPSTRCNVQLVSDGYISVRISRRKSAKSGVGAAVVGPGEGTGVVGASVGPGVGRGVGAAVVGACEGSGVVGMAVVGTAVVGWADGMELVGSTVGEGVGTADGTAVVGEKVGPCVGAAVGAQATVAVDD